MTTPTSQGMTDKGCLDNALLSARAQPIIEISPHWPKALVQGGNVKAEKVEPDSDSDAPEI